MGDNLSIYLSIYLSLFISIYLSISVYYLLISINLSINIYISINPSVYIYLNLVISFYLSIYIYIYIYHVVSLERISLTLSRHFSLSLIASGRSSGLHPVSLHSCCMFARVGRPAFAWSYVRAHRSTSLMSSCWLLLQCPACQVRLT